MPLRTYRTVTGSCRLCCGRFERGELAGETPLATCERCGLAVVREEAESVAVPKILAPVQPSRARTAGFTVFRRTADGSYERQ